MDMNVYAAATPAVLAIVAAEAAWCLYQKNGYYRFDDAMANFATAIGHQITNVAVGAGAFFAFAAVHARWPLADWGGSPATFAALYLGVDFLFYWFHRMGHAVNVLWAAHSPHHSSDELNYTVGLRASLTQRAASFLFFAPLALAARPEVVLPLISLHLLFQLLPHTRVVRRLPRWIEAFVNCPTHHRVHHAINERYLDKNFSGTFIVWDKLFGTFAAEIEEPIYGDLLPAESFGPIDINLRFWKLLWNDAVAAPRWSDKVKLWFMPTGWRPEGVAELPPIPPVRGRIPLRTGAGSREKALMVSSLPILLAAMLTITEGVSPLPLAGRAALGAAVWAVLIAWGVLLNRGASRSATISAWSGSSASSTRPLPTTAGASSSTVSGLAA